MKTKINNQRIRGKRIDENEWLTGLLIVMPDDEDGNYGIQTISKA